MFTTICKLALFYLCTVTAYRPIVVDNSTFGDYPLTRQGLQDATNFATSLDGGGNIQVWGNIESDGVSYYTKPNVRIDFNGYEFKMKNDNTSYDMILCSSGVSSQKSITAPITEGDTLVYLSSVSGYSPGDYIMIYPLKNPLIFHVSPIYAVDSISNTIDMVLPCPFDIPDYGNFTAYKWSSSTVTRFQLKNVILNGNGNSGIMSRLFVCVYSIEMYLQSVRVTGTLTATKQSSSGIHLYWAYASMIDDVSAMNFNSPLESNDICFQYMIAPIITRIRSTNSAGFGPSILGTYMNTDLMTLIGSKARGIKFSTTKFSSISSIVSTGHRSDRGTGIGFHSGFQNNIISNLVSVFNDNQGLVFFYDPDINNQVYGLFAKGNKLRDLYLGTGVNGNSGNVVYGRISDSSKSLNGNLKHSLVSVDKNNYITYVPALTEPQSSDFPTCGMAILNIVNDTYFQFNYKNKNCAIKRYILGGLQSQISSDNSNDISNDNSNVSTGNKSTPYGIYLLMVFLSNLIVFG